MINNRSGHYLPDDVLLSEIAIKIENFLKVQKVKTFSYYDNFDQKHEEFQQRYGSFFYQPPPVGMEYAITMPVLRS